MKIEIGYSTSDFDLGTDKVEIYNSQNKGLGIYSIKAKTFRPSLSADFTVETLKLIVEVIGRIGMALNIARVEAKDPDFYTR